MRTTPSKKLTFITLIVLAIIANGCKKTEVPDEVITDEIIYTESGVRIITPKGNEQYLNSEPEYLFDQDSLYTYELILPESALEEIDKDPTAEEYVEGTLVFLGDTISPVGIRYKGSIGAFVGCVSSLNFAEPSGYKTCPKLSMKVKINWEGREEKFYKLKKLQFHSMNNDNSQMRERLGYWLFGEMGIPTPRCVHAKLVINGDYVGVFALVEQIDNRFIKQNFNDDLGNLYKEVWPLTADGVPHDDQRYIDVLKTNENSNPNISLIKSFAQKMADAEPQDARTILESHTKIDELISYAVVDRTIRHDDGPFHWYCNQDPCESHNFYWYEEPNNELLHLIPWDLDHAFENIINDVNFVTPIADEWGQTRNNCEPFRYGLFRLQQKSASCDKITETWATYKDEYESKKQEFINGPFSSSSVHQMLDKWEVQIREATAEAKEQHTEAISLGEWKAAINELKNQVDFARTK